MHRPMAVIVGAWVLVAVCLVALVVGVVDWARDDDGGTNIELLCAQAELEGVNLPECP